MENNNEIVKEEQIRKEIKILVQVLLATNMPLDRIAEITNIPVDVIQKRLNDKERIIDIFTKDVINIIFKDGINGFLPINGEEIYNEIQKRKEELKDVHYVKDISLPLKLINYYQDEKYQYKLLAHMMLTFRTKLITLEESAEIHIDPVKLKLYNNGIFGSIVYLTYNDNTPQETALNNFMEYYKKLLTSDREKNINEFNELVREISDFKAKQIRNDREPGEPLTEDIILTMLKYQLKYAIGYKKVAAVFGVSGKQYNYDVLKFIDNNPEYRDAYETLIDHNKKYFFENGGIKR